MNDLETKILNMMLDVNKDGDKERVKAVSQFFLEEIKEAWNNGFEEAYLGHTSLKINAKDYLKSKYNIED